jgi:uncharacterized protein (DUF1499 family)
MRPDLTPRIVVLAAALAVSACAPGAPVPPGPAGARLAPCPESPNCVGSAETSERHAIAGLALVSPAADAWPRVVAVVRAMPRTTVVTAGPHYLHAEARSRSGLFTDDLELLLLDPATGAVQVRSASRVGYSDLGANRSRVEDLRSRLAALGLLR